MTWGAVAIGGASLVGGMMAADATNSAAQTQADAANFMNNQKLPYLQEGWKYGQDQFNAAQKMGNAYSGQRVADLNPFSTTGANQAGSFATNQGAQGAQQLFGASQGMLGAGQNFGANAQNLFNQAGQNPTQQILANAGQYAANPYVDGMIDAANRDVSRSLYEQQLPGLDRAASGTGNTNSTRAGVESAILQRGAADRMADTASNIRSQFFGQGLNLAQNQYQNNMSNQLNANSQLGNAFTQGSNGMLSSQQMNGNNFDQANAAGSMYQTQNQNVLNANQQAWNEQRTGGLDLLSKYMNVYGEVGNYQAPQYTSPLQSGMGAMTSGLGLYGKLGGFNKDPAPTYNPNSDPTYGVAAQSTANRYSFDPAAGGWGVE